MESQESPEGSIQGCISCLQQPSVKGRQVTGDVLGPDGAWSPRSLIKSSGVGSEYLVRICLPIHMSHMPKLTTQSKLTVCKPIN